MKKVLALIMVVLVSMTALAGVEKRSVAVKFGATFGTLDSDTSRGDKDLELGRDLMLEYLFRLDNGIDLGVGAGIEEFDIENLDVTLGLGDIESYPVYGVIRYRFQPIGEFNPYVYGNLGYAFIDHDRGTSSADDGMYLGLGAGVEFLGNLGAEIGWSRTYLDAEFAGKSIDPVADLFKFNVVLKLDH